MSSLSVSLGPVHIVKKGHKKTWEIYLTRGQIFEMEGHLFDRKGHLF